MVNVVVIVCQGRIVVVDTANHRIVAFDAATLEKICQYPPVDWVMERRGKYPQQLDGPMDIAAFEGELFVSDTHNDRIQVFSTKKLEYIGTIGQKGKGPGQFI